MKSTIFPLILVAAAAGAICGGATAFFASSPPPADPGPLHAPRAAAVPDELFAELESLRQENRDLAVRLDALENRPEAIPTAPFSIETTREELLALKEAVADLKPPREAAVPSSGDDAQSPDLDETSPEFAATVEKTLQTIRKREKADRWRAGTKKARDHIEDRLVDLTTRLNLTTPQVDDLRTAFVAEVERGNELIQLWEAGDTPDEQLGEIKRTNHELHQQALATILSPEQLERFHAKPIRSAK